MKLNRRGFFGAAAGAVAAAPGLATAAKTSESVSSMQGGMNGHFNAMSSPQINPAVSPQRIAHLIKVVRAGGDEERIKRNRAYGYNSHRIDEVISEDVLALKATSKTYKVRRLLERREELDRAMQYTQALYELTEELGIPAVKWEDYL